MSWSFYQIYILCPHACMLSHFSRVQLFATLWTIPYLAPLSKGFSRQEYWSRLPCSPLLDHPNAGIKPMSPVAPSLQTNSLPLNHQGSLKVYLLHNSIYYFLRLWHDIIPCWSLLIYSCKYLLFYIYQEHFIWVGME